MGKLQAVTVFADCGVTPHQPQYRHVGEFIARRKVRLVTVARNGEWPNALVDTVLAHGGKATVVTVSGDDGIDVPHGVGIEFAPDERAAGLRAAELGDAIIGLPCGLEATAMLYAAWSDAGGARSGKPVGLLNRRQAFEVVRGFLTDVATVGLGGVDHLVQVSENFEDLWSRLTRLAVDRQPSISG